MFNIPDWKKVESLERRSSAKKLLLVEKSPNLDGWSEEEKQENPIKKKLCSGCQHFGKKMKVESSGLIFCAGCRQKNTRAKSK